MNKKAEAGAALAAAIAPPAEDRAAIADEFGALANQIELFKPTVARHKELREKMQLWHDTSPADKSFTVDGAIYSVEISARAMERTILSMGKLFKFLGMRKFLSLCSFTLNNVDDYVTVDKRDQFVSQTQTGDRSVKAKAVAKVVPVVSSRPPFETFKRPTCRGCFAFGTACGHCERCDWERNQSAGKAA